MKHSNLRAVVFVSLLIAIMLGVNLLTAAQDKKPPAPPDPTQQAERDKIKQKDAQQPAADKSTQSAPNPVAKNSDSDKKFVLDAAHDGMMEIHLAAIATERAASDEVKQYARRLIDDHAKANDELMQLASSKGITIPNAMPDQPTPDATAADTSKAAPADRPQKESPLTRKTEPTNKPVADPGKRTDMPPPPEPPQDTKTAPKDQPKMDHPQMDPEQKAIFDKLSGLSGAEFDREYISLMVKDHEKAVSLFEQVSTTSSDPEIKAWAAGTLPTLQEHLKIARDLQAKVGGPSK
jgi:putative membrane protein